MFTKELNLSQMQNSDLRFEEEEIEEYFREFQFVDSTVVSIDIVYIEESFLRIVAFGCEDGYIRVTMYNYKTNSWIRKDYIQHDTVITSVKLFTLAADEVPHPKFINKNLGGGVSREEPLQGKKSHRERSYHLLVLSALEPAVIYWHVAVNAFSCQTILPNSNHFDVVTCACVTDIDFDGINEILIGTYGQQILTYKFEETLETVSPNKSESATETLDRHYALVSQKQMAHPIHAIECIDLNNDGVKELVVLSLRGVHVLQHDTKFLFKEVGNRLEELIRSLKHKEESEEIVEEKEEEIPSAFV